MDRIPGISNGAQSTNIGEAVNFIEQNAMGIPTVVDAAPTVDELKANSIVKHGNSIYIKFSDAVTIRIDGTII